MSIYKKINFKKSEIVYSIKIWWNKVVEYNCHHAHLPGGPAFDETVVDFPGSWSSQTDWFSTCRGFVGFWMSCGRSCSSREAWAAAKWRRFPRMCRAAWLIYAEIEWPSYLLAWGSLRHNHWKNNYLSLSRCCPNLFVSFKSSFLSYSHHI